MARNLGGWLAQIPIPFQARPHSDSQHHGAYLLPQLALKTAPRDVMGLPLHFQIRHLCCLQSRPHSAAHWRFPPAYR